MNANFTIKISIDNEITFRKASPSSKNIFYIMENLLIYNNNNNSIKQTL